MNLTLRFNLRIFMGILRRMIYYWWDEIQKCKKLEVISMIIFIVLINSDTDVLFSISNIRPGVSVSFFSKSTRNFILEKFSKFRELMKWFSVILISSAFSSVPELDSRRRIPLASSWHNDSLTKVSRKRFQNHRKLTQTHSF